MKLSFFPDKRILAGFFVTALSTLVFELLISRVMSVVAWYHFAFMAICLALFGMTVGAVIVHKNQDVFVKHYYRTLYFFSIFFSVSIFLNLLMVSFFPVFTNLSVNEWLTVYHPLNIVLIFTSIVLPLICSGIVISLVLSKHVEHANKVYFVDLAGASLGCLLFIPILNFLGVVFSYVLLALLGLLASFFFNLCDASPRKKFIGVLAIFFIFCAFMNIKTGFLELQWAKGQQDNRSFYKKWNSFSYIRLKSLRADSTPQGWGFAPRKRVDIGKMKIGQVYLDIDAAAGTTMSSFENRDLRTIGFLKYDITSLPYQIVNNGDVLIIGIGAGRDILTGLLFNQKSITGVEINDTILDVHKRLLARFSGDLSRHPKVTFVHNEARSYINASQRKFDLIQLSLIDTFAATQAGAYALTENNLYTVEGLTAYLNHLTELGFVSISYWMHPGNPEAMLRLTGAATKALAHQGITNVRAHMVIVHKDGSDNGRGVANLLVKKTPFTNVELAVIEKYCAEMGFHLILSPSISSYDSFTAMSDPRYLDEFVKNYKMNISPATDDQPFFFLLTRLNIWKFLSEFKLFSFSAEHILFSLLGVMFILTCLFVVVPLLAESGMVAAQVHKLSFSIYFTAIGLAFMFIEMSQLTRLSSFLGHPVYSLSIVLFSFLISSGLGSNFLGCIDNRRQILTYSGVFVLICLLSIFFTMPALAFFSKFPIGVRLFLSVCLVFPLGFFMGSFLPQGMRLLGQKKGPVALYWGLNGATSVLGSILAMIFQITWGLNITFACGVLLYLVAMGTLLKLKFSVAG